MNVQETLSALMDDACEAQELDRLLAGMAEDSAAMRQWSQMCAQRDAREGLRALLIAEAHGDDEGRGDECLDLGRDGRPLLRGAGGGAHPPYCATPPR